MDLTSTDVEHAAVAQDDGQTAHPPPRAAVLEGGCPRGIGRHDAAREGAVEGGDRRVKHSTRPQLLLQRTEGDACLNGDGRVADLDDPVETFGGHHRVAHRRCPAGERRLRANREKTSGVSNDRGHVTFGAGSSHGHRVATGKMTRVLEIPADHVGVAGNRVGVVAGSGCGSRPDRVGSHRALIIRHHHMSMPRS